MKTLKIKDGDLYIDRSTGLAKEIVGAELLAQAIPDALLTDFDGTWGSELFPDNADQTRRKRSINANVSIIDTRITEAVERIRIIQTQDVSLTPEETFQEIRELIVFPFSERGSFFFFLSIINSSNKPIDIGFEEIATLNHLIPIFFSNTEIKKTKTIA